MLSFKNMKISVKLILGFSVIALIAAIVGVVGVSMLLTSDDQYASALGENTQAITALAELREGYQSERAALRDVVLATSDGADAVNAKIAEFNKEAARVSAGMAAYGKTITNKTQEAKFYDAQAAYTGAYTAAAKRACEYALAGNYSSAVGALQQTSAQANTIALGLADSANVNNEETAALFNVFSGNTSRTALFLGLVMLMGIAAAIALGFYNSYLIGVPVKGLCEALNITGTTGSLTLPPELAKLMREVAQRKDELGQSAAAYGKLMERLEYVSGQLELVASGDIASEVVLASGQDIMGLSLQKMSDGLNSMFADINNAAAQVAEGSTQIAQSSQGLAYGATEQASSIEEFSSAVAEVMKNVESNAQSAEKSLDMTSHAGELMHESMESMNRMLTAMSSIDESSQSIKKIIKVIDDIAFQTNILALNAAVEAARAGQQGKGFAVVADEVRNLAAKSAAAAKETANLIEGSSIRVKEGNQIVAHTSKSLSTLGEKAKENLLLTRTIVEATNEQTRAINELNIGIGQISTVVQSNSATSEQSAASAEEMSAQAAILQQMIARFKLRGGEEKQECAAVPETMQRAEHYGQTDFALQGGSKY